MPARIPPLLPQPRLVEARQGGLRLRTGLPIALGPGADDGDLASARALRDGLEAAAGVRLAVEGHARTEDLGPCLVLRRGAAGEGYRLALDASGVALDADGPAGLRWGVETLLQLVDRRGRLPACRIEDAPALPRRGLMLDVSRGKVPTAASLRELVDRCARLKLNVLMLYVEHTFHARRHPDLGAGHSPLEAETLRELDAYAAERHVELVPSLQSLGHMEKLLSLPAYADLAESDARWTVAPTEPRTYAVLGDLLDELLPNFRSPLFNANCDEPWDLGRGRSRERAEALGPGGLYLEHVRRVRDLARARGKRTLIWGDVVHAYPERIPEIDRDLVLLDWWYEAGFDFDRVKSFTEHGLEFWVCPGTSSWNCLFPRVANSLANISGYADAGRRHGATGLLVTDWGDFGHYNLQGNSWLGMAWAAQTAWSGDAPAAAFDRAFSRCFFGDPSGEAARLYRDLGDVHEAGFRVFNASPLMFLWFDDLERGYFVEASRAAALGRSRRKLEGLRERLARAAPRLAADPTTAAELAYAADASLLAVRKGEAGRRYIAWRRDPTSLSAAARRGLGRELAALADEQAHLARTFRRLWLARSRPSDLEAVKRRIERSVRSLRRAGRALAANRPPAPPPPHPGIEPATLFRILRELTRGV